MNTKSQIINALCIDVDDLAGSQYEAGYVSKQSTYLVVQETSHLLADLDVLGVRATFFVPGLVVRRSPHLVKAISASGHHIAAHGTIHRRVYEMSRGEFLADVLVCKKSLEDLIGQAVDTYKAPQWSITPACLWAYDVLIEAGYTVDHSAMPSLKQALGYHPSHISPFRYKDHLIVIPATVVHVAGTTLRCNGGFHTAHMPIGVQRWFLQRLNKLGLPFNYFFHPYEYAPAQENRKLIKFSSLRASMYGIHFGVFKTHLKALARYFQFGTLPEAYHAWLS